MCDFEDRLADSGVAWLGGRIVIPYCTIGYRSGHYTRDLQSRELGLTVRNLAGSILAWTHAGGPLVAPGAAGAAGQAEETRRLHVYGAAWDLAPRAYETQRFDG